MSTLCNSLRKVVDNDILKRRFNNCIVQLCKGVTHTLWYRKDFVRMKPK